MGESWFVLFKAITLFFWFIYINKYMARNIGDYTFNSNDFIGDGNGTLGKVWSIIYY